MLTRSTVLASGLVALAACASPAAVTSNCPPTGVPSTPTPAPAPAPPAAAGPAQEAALAPRIVQAVGSYAAVSRIKLRTDLEGRVTKVALYHGDAAQVPAAVLDQAKTELPGAEVQHYELEHYADLGWVHEVEVKKPSGELCELSLREDGSLVYLECAIDPTSLPAPIAEATARMFPTGKVLEAEAKKGPDLDVVMVEVEVGGREHYLRMSPRGELLDHWLKIPAVIEVPVR